MGRKRLGVKGYTPEQIKDLINKDEKFKIGLRLNAVYQIALGRSSRELEGFYNTSFKQITNWVHRFEEDGLKGLMDKPGRGRKSRLSENQQQQIHKLLTEESPLDYGYNTDTWTGPLLIDWVERHFQITYKKAQIYNVMKNLGFTYQKSRGFYPEADPEKQEEFKEQLKKTSGESS